jgi:HSP20 family protein
VWDDIFSVRNELDKWFGRYGNGETLSSWAPVVDVKETADDITVRAELPGLNPEDVNVSVQDGVLTISGEKHDEREEGKADTNYHLLERRYGRFERSFSLPRTVNANDVKANFQNGVLNVTLAKAEEAKPRRIEVKVEKK